MKTIMYPNGEIKEVAGFLREELYEHGDSPMGKKKAQKGCDMCNEGRVKDGRAPKTTVRVMDSATTAVL